MDKIQNNNSQNKNGDDIVNPDDVKHQQAKPPSVTGEEDTFSGDMPQESADIDEELEKVGLHGDEEGVKPLGVKGQIDEEEK